MATRQARRPNDASEHAVTIATPNLRYAEKRGINIGDNLWALGAISRVLKPAPEKSYFGNDEGMVKLRNKRAW